MGQFLYARWFPWVWFIGLALLAYGNSFSMELFGDDLGYIAFGGWMYEGGLGGLFQGPLADRPLLMLSMAVNRLWSGENPFGYRLVNVLLHGGVGACAWHFVKTLKPQLSNRERGIGIGILSLFVVHPLNNQAVNLIIQRGVLLAGIFLLLATYYLVKFCKKPHLKNGVFCTLFFLLALLAKPIGIVFPLVGAFYMGCFAKDLGKKKYPLLFGLISVSLVPVFFYFGLKMNVQGEAGSWWQYFSYQGLALNAYWTRLLIPMNFRFLYDFGSEGFTAEKVLSLLFHGGLFLSLIVGALKTGKLWLFFGGAMAIFFIPESSIFPIYHKAFEHRAYVPFLFLFMGLALLFMTIDLSKKTLLSVSLPLVLFLIGSNWHRSSEISTYKSWVWNTLGHNSGNTSFNVFQLDHFLETDLEFGGQIAKMLTSVHPKSEVYRVYEQMFQSQLSGSLHQQDETLALVREKLTRKNHRFHKLARDSFNRFYIRKKSLGSLDFATAEKYDALIFPQVREFYRNLKFFKRYFRAYAKRLAVLSRNDRGASRPPVVKAQFLKFRVQYVLATYYNSGDWSQSMNRFQKFLGEFPELKKNPGVSEMLEAKRK